MILFNNSNSNLYLKTVILVECDLLWYKGQIRMLENKIYWDILEPFLRLKVSDFVYLIWLI